MFAWDARSEDAPLADGTSSGPRSAAAMNRRARARSPPKRNTQVAARDSCGSEAISSSVQPSSHSRTVSLRPRLASSSRCASAIRPA